MNTRVQLPQEGQVALQSRVMQVAQQHRLNFAEIGNLVAFVGQHPEVLQLVNLVARLKGNPDMVPAVQAQGDKILVALLALTESAVQYAVDSITKAGATPSAMLTDLDTFLDGWLAKYGAQIGPPAATVRVPDHAARAVTTPAGAPDPSRQVAPPQPLPDSPQG